MDVFHIYLTADLFGVLALAGHGGCEGGTVEQHEVFTSRLETVAKTRR